jgi:hypothetical protein
MLLGMEGMVMVGMDIVGMVMEGIDMEGMFICHNTTIPPSPLPVSACDEPAPHGHHIYPHRVVTAARRSCDQVMKLHHTATIYTHTGW